jgi:hypothetical protein
LGEGLSIRNEEREMKMTTNETGKKKMMKHNFTVAYLGYLGTVTLRDTYTFTKNKGEAQARNQLLKELTEDEEGTLDDFHTIYRGLEEVMLSN